MQAEHLTAQELADIFGVSLPTIHKWCQRRDLPHHRTLGGHLRFDTYKLRKYCEEREIIVPEGLKELTRWPSSR